METNRFVGGGYCRVRDHLRPHLSTIGGSSFSRPMRLTLRVYARPPWRQCDVATAFDSPSTRMHEVKYTNSRWKSKLVLVSCSPELDVYADAAACIRRTCRSFRVIASREIHEMHSRMRLIQHFIYFSPTWRDPLLDRIWFSVIFVGHVLKIYRCRRCYHRITIFFLFVTKYI